LYIAALLYGAFPLPIANVGLAAPLTPSWRSPKGVLGFATLVCSDIGNSSALASRVGEFLGAITRDAGLAGENIEPSTHAARGGTVQSGAAKPSTHAARGGTVRLSALASRLIGGTLPRVSSYPTRGASTHSKI
jgi:hypothetical protein